MQMEVEERERPKAYRMPEVARLLGLSERKIDDLVATGELKSFKVGKSRRVSAEALDLFIKKRERAGR